MTAPMSITDELRKWAEDNTLKDTVLATYPPQHAVHGTLETLLRIAGRIDAEYQKAIRELNNLADTSVLLPVDADGVPIRFGDKVTVSWSEKVYEVRGFSYTERLANGERTIWVDVYSLEKMGNIPLCGANSCHHYHEPTVEDVLRDFAYCCEEGATEQSIDEIIAEYAAKLRLANSEE